MTVSYNLDVASGSVTSFVRLLFRWRGSIWKPIASELTVWLCGYYAVMIIYRNLLRGESQRRFERIAEHYNSKLSCIPLTFMLGFFVTAVVDRWRKIFQNLGWIENVAFTVSSQLRGNSQNAILYRRTIVRYAVVSQILVFRDVSMRVRRRFPDLESLVDAGFLQKHELKSLEGIKLSYNKYWAPINWALTTCTKAYEETCFEALSSMVAVQNELKNFRSSLAQISNFDWVPIPIAYPQVNIYVPFMTILQFVFFVGWMKVAESLLNPLGEDDDDFECDLLIDQNIATGLMIVDKTYDQCPILLQDRIEHSLYSEHNEKRGHDCVLHCLAETTRTDHHMCNHIEKDSRSGKDELNHDLRNTWFIQYMWTVFTVYHLTALLTLKTGI